MSQAQVNATALLCRLLERDKPEINGQALVTDHPDAATHLLRERLLVLGRTLDWVTCPECGIETARVMRELSPDRIALRCPDCAEAQAPRRLRETHKVALQRVIAALLNGLGLSANGLKPIDHELTWRLGTTEPTRGKALTWYFARRRRYKWPWPVATVGCGRSRVGKPAILPRSLIEKRSTAATSAAWST
jgi:hypothetical protein